MGLLDELKQLRQWVLWKYTIGKNGKRTKIPINPHNGTRASTIDPTTWGTIQDCVNSKQLFSADGYGFVFSKDTPYVGIDLDECVLGDGEFTEFAKRHISEFNSYTEYSPSKRGIHIIAKADFNFSGYTSKRIEIYSHGRFFTMTGDIILDVPIKDCSEALTYRVQPERDTTLLDVTEDSVKEALSYIPGHGLDYGEWFQIICALHSEFPNETGLSIAKDWTGAYCQPNELERLWRRSLDANKGTRINTLFYFARIYGYKPTREHIHDALAIVEPKLTDEQMKQAVANTEQVVTRLVDEKVWIKYNSFLKKNNRTPFPDQILDYYNLGLRRNVDDNTGEIIEAITVPYFSNGSDTPHVIEYRYDNGLVYEGEPSIYNVQDMFNDTYNFGIVLPDTLAALNFYLNGDNHSGVHALPSDRITYLENLPEYPLYVIVTQEYLGNKLLRPNLEILDRNNARFIVVYNVEEELKLLTKQEIYRKVIQGRKLEHVI